jgi:hypothetical protein
VLKNDACGLRKEGPGLKRLLKKWGGTEKQTPAAKAALRTNTFGTAEAVPLSKTDFFSTLYRPAALLRLVFLVFGIASLRQLSSRCRGSRKRQQQKQERNTGVLRCAQNDKVFSYSIASVKLHI